MGKVAYRERIETINSILQVPANSESSVSKTELWHASKTSFESFDKIYKALVQMGCLKEEKSNGPSRKYEITTTEKGLELFRRTRDIMPYLEEIKKYWKE